MVQLSSPFMWCIAGAHSSTAEVEHELMDLWNAVEKDKVVQAARRAAAARNKTRMEPAQPPLKKVQSSMQFFCHDKSFTVPSWVSEVG